MWPAGGISSVSSKETKRLGDLKGAVTWRFSLFWKKCANQYKTLTLPQLVLTILSGTQGIILKNSTRRFFSWNPFRS